VGLKPPLSDDQFATVAYTAPFPIGLFHADVALNGQYLASLVCAWAHPSDISIMARATISIIRSSRVFMVLHPPVNLL
jgi:hypothetical protein